jgi:hypothetical protein
MKRRISVALATMLAAGILSFGAAQPAAAESGKEKGWRIGTYALAAGTAYAAFKKKPTLALVGAGATYLAHQQWKKQVNERHKDRRRAVRHRAVRHAHKHRRACRH